MNSNNYIIIGALKAELKGLDKYAPLVHTGVGKINATIQTYEAILKYRPNLVINYGTAGSLKNQTGLLKVETFIQRDMDVSGLGFLRGETPFSNKKLPQAKGIVLGTGDSFVTDAKKQLAGLNISIDLVDMEAFAIKEVCCHLKIQFRCYKYISDNADSSAGDNWQENINKGIKSFTNLLSKKYGKSGLLV